MALVDIRVPQLGEGLQEALVVALLKAAGSQVEKDEPIFEMETDKARVVVEAALRGPAARMARAAGDVVPIGAVIGRIESDTAIVADAHIGSTRAPNRPAGAMARTASAGRRFVSLRELGHTGGRSDSRTRNCAGFHRPRESSCRRMWTGTWPTRARTAADTGPRYRERRLSAQQRALTFRFRRSAQLVIPATIICPLAWTSVERALQVARTEHPDVPIGVLGGDRIRRRARPQARIRTSGPSSSAMIGSASIPT